MIKLQKWLKVRIKQKKDVKLDEYGYCPDLCNWVNPMNQYQGDEFIIDRFDEDINRAHYKGWNWSPHMLELVEEFQEWERILARRDDEHEWKERIYLCTVPWDAENKYVCVYGWDEEEYKKWEKFENYLWKFAKKIEPKKKMTIAEIEKELGYSIEVIK